MSKPRNLLVGISGVSSSGKTTLSRLLRDIFPGTFILHEDDFYKPDGEIPVRQDGVQDWDCLEALDLPAMEAALAHIRAHGTSPPGLVSKEDRNSVGEIEIEVGVVERLRQVTTDRLCLANGTRVAIVDGFLLFAEEMSDVRDLFDVKLFLRTSRRTAKGRREARKGYVTLEGFWEDPPDYVDKVVWPNFVKDHAFLFNDGDVEGEADEEVCQSLGIEVMPTGAQDDMTLCLQWAHSVLCRALESDERSCHLS